MGYNRSGTIRTGRLKRRRREVKRFVERCEAANAEAQKQGKQPTDFTKAIRAFAETRKPG